MLARSLKSLGIASLAALSLARDAEAAAPKEVTIAGGGGLKPLAVIVDVEHRRVRVSVAGAASELPIELGSREGHEGDAGNGSTSADVLVEPVALGDGKSVVHVRVAAQKDADVAWEAILAGRDAPVLWSGTTGYAKGEAGERTGESLELIPTDDEGGRVVAVGAIEEDVRLCGQAMTLLSPRVLDVASLTFRGATMQRLPDAQREGAERIIASARGGPADAPLARLLVATGASTALGSPSAVTDGNPGTSWSEGRPTDGHGEFVVMRAPAVVPIPRLAITLAPPSPSAALAHGAAPRSFFLVTDDRTIAVTLPEDAWLHPGGSYEIALVDPLRTSCLALVLDKAYLHAGETRPDVTVSELTAYSAFDAPGATLDQAAKALAGGGPRGEAAKEVLEHAGDPGLAAATKAFGSLDAAGRALAIDAAIGAGTCEASAPLLLSAMGDPDREVARKGGEKLERCGKRAVPALLGALGGGDEAVVARAARLVASIAPSEALEPLVGALGRGTAETRAAVRSGIAKAARGAAKETLVAALRAKRSDEAAIDLLRALESELPRIAPEGDAAIATLDGVSASMPTRYLLIGPIAAIARAGDADAVARLTAAIARDPDPAVRAHAAEKAAQVPRATEALVHAVESDEAPRVREAALEALTPDETNGKRKDLPSAPIARRLAEDEWTFVRAAAATTLAAMPADPAADKALEAALGDASPVVRQGALGGLAAHQDAHAAEAIRARLADVRETLEVRLAAVKALASLCDRDAVELLTTLARRTPLPMAADEDIQVGFEAAVALGRIHPADLAARLAPLAAKGARSEAQTAAARALAMAPGCR